MTLYGELGSQDKTILWYEKSYHLLLHDVQRKDVLDDATHWVKTQLHNR